MKQVYANGINLPQNMASVMSQHQRVHFTPIFILIFQFYSQKPKNLKSLILFKAIPVPFLEFKH